MTRNEEVIRHLLLLKDCAIKSHNDTGIININIDSFNFVIDMAIQALEQEPCEDAISRDAVIEKAVYTETEEGWCGYTVDVDYIKSLSFVKPQDCDTCEVGNPCLYCKHDFEPQESEDKE